MKKKIIELTDFDIYVLQLFLHENPYAAICRLELLEGHKIKQQCPSCAISKSKAKILKQLEELK